MSDKVEHLRAIREGLEALRAELNLPDRDDTRMDHIIVTADLSEIGSADVRLRLHKSHCHSDILKDLGCHHASESGPLVTTKMEVAKVLNVLSIHGYRIISTCSSSAGCVWTMGKKMGVEEHDWRRHNQETVHSWWIAWILALL